MFSSPSMVAYLRLYQVLVRGECNDSIWAIWAKVIAVNKQTFLFVFLINLKNRLHKTSTEVKVNSSLLSFLEVSRGITPSAFFSEVPRDTSQPQHLHLHTSALHVGVTCPAIPGPLPRHTGRARATGLAWAEMLTHSATLAKSPALKTELHQQTDAPVEFHSAGQGLTSGMAMVRGTDWEPRYQGPSCPPYLKPKGLHYPTSCQFHPLPELLQEEKRKQKEEVTWLWPSFNFVIRPCSGPSKGFQNYPFGLIFFFFSYIFLFSPFIISMKSPLSSHFPYHGTINSLKQ